MSRAVKTALIWIILLGIVAFGLTYRNGGNEQATAIVDAQTALQMIDDGEIQSYQIQKRGLILKTGRSGRLLIRPMKPEVIKRLNDHGIQFDSNRESSDTTTNMIATVIVVLLVLVAVFYFLRRMSGGHVNQIFELRKTKARPVDATDKARFTDIGGNREAVEMLVDIVDFLRNPDRWKTAKARLPRGILMVGPPGTGKTLLARAVAGETKSAFFYTSATEFMEMFVGVGAARVRDTFEKAAAQQPAVVFIDELDAIGRRRGSGVGTMHEEREQTLNQLLVALDGLERHDRLVVIAATNRIDVLDPALLRSGRFDRVLRLDAPEQEERVEILKIHTRDKPLAPGVSLERIAHSTEGFTGADLESLTNDAALSAVRRCRETANDQESVMLTMDDFDRSLKGLTKSNRQFDRLDSVLVESVSQFAEPSGRALARITLTTGTIVEGEVLWMNSDHIKLRLVDESEVIVAKDMAEQIVRLEGTEMARADDFRPDRWAEGDIDAG